MELPSEYPMSRGTARRLAGWMRRGQETPNVREKRWAFIQHTSEGYLCCALGLALVGMADGNAWVAFFRLQQELKATDGNLPQAMANILLLSSDELRSISGKHEKGYSARYIIAGLEAIPAGKVNRRRVA